MDFDKPEPGSNTEDTLTKQSMLTQCSWVRWLWLLPCCRISNAIPGIINYVPEPLCTFNVRRKRYLVWERNSDKKWTLLGDFHPSLRIFEGPHLKYLDIHGCPRIGSQWQNSSDFHSDWHPLEQIIIAYFTLKRFID